MPDPVRIIGTYISPYVRKVLVCLDLKGIPYRIDPIVPFFGDDEFSKLSPVRRIPVLSDDRVTLCDSSVICQYLEDRHPEPSLYPGDAALRARARWLEEYADTRMGEVFIWGLFNELAVKPFVWGEPADPEVLARIREREIPDVLDYLEGELPADGFALGPLSIADVSLAAFFRNAAFAGFEVDAGRWPGTAAWLGRVLALPAFESLRPYEDLSVRTPIPKHREALAAAGAPLTEQSLGTDTPRRGVLKT